MRTVCSVRVELEVDLEFDGYWGSLDNLATARLFGARLVDRYGDELAVVGLSEMTVLGQREEEDWRDRDAASRARSLAAGGYPGEISDDCGECPRDSCTGCEHEVGDEPPDGAGRRAR